MADDDKREAKRIAYPCEVECYGVGVGISPLNPRISDLSVTGAFIDSMITLPAGSTVKLKFDLPSGQIAVTAEVVHAMPQFGMGVRFLDLTAEQHKAIEDVVRDMG